MAYTNENQQLMQKLSGEISKVIRERARLCSLFSRLCWRRGMS